MQNYFSNQSTVKVNQVTSVRQIYNGSNAATVSVFTASLALLLLLAILASKEYYTSFKRRRIQSLEQIWHISPKDNFK